MRSVVGSAGMPLSSAWTCRRFSRSFEVERVDRSLQTDARAQPARPGGGAAKSAPWDPLARIRGRELAVRRAARLRRRRPRWRRVATAHGAIRTGCAAPPPARQAQGELPAPDAE